MLSKSFSHSEQLALNNADVHNQRQRKHVTHTKLSCFVLSYILLLKAIKQCCKTAAYRFPLPTCRCWNRLHVLQTVRLSLSQATSRRCSFSSPHAEIATSSDSRTKSSTSQRESLMRSITRLPVALSMLSETEETSQKAVRRAAMQ